MTKIYTLTDFANVRMNGFDIVLPEDTMIIISELSQQVGSPTYIRTPNFQKKDRVLQPNVERKGEITRQWRLSMMEIGNC